MAYDYALRLAAGRADATERLLAPALAKLTGFSPAGAAGNWSFCDLANATVCPALEAAGAGTTVAVLLFNSQAQAVAAAPVRIPVPTPAAAGSYAVADAHAAPVLAQLVPASPFDAFLRETYYAYAGPRNVTWLAFEAALPPGGYAVYFVTPVASAAEAPSTVASVVHAALAPSSADAIISNANITLTFSGTTGLLAHFADAATGVDSALAQELRYYAASDGDWPHNLPAAGAYFMRPALNTTSPLLAPGAAAALVTLSGPVVSEAWQTFTPWASQVFRLWRSAPDVELQFDLGAVNVSDGVGKEIVSVLTAPAIANAGAFFTDGNGRDSVLRVRDHRSGWNQTILEPVAANFYVRPR